MIKLNEMDSNNYNLKELDTTVVINSDYSSLFSGIDTNTLFMVLVDYTSTGMTRIAPIAARSDFECGYDQNNVVCVERDCLLVLED